MSEPGLGSDNNYRNGVVLLALVGLATAVLVATSLSGGDGDVAEAPTSEAEVAAEAPQTTVVERSEQSPRRATCNLNEDDLEDLTGFEEVVESIECNYWAGYIRPGENADAQCAQVLGYARSLDPDVSMVKIKDRSGETHADCR